MAGVRPTPDHKQPDREASGHAGRAEAATLAKLALGMTLFGSATPVSKIVIGAMPVFMGVALRVAIGALVLMPASALILSYVLLGEPFRVIHLAGFAIVFASVRMIGWDHARMARASDRKTGE